MIAILGGGITAIAAAIELHKQGKDFVLIEKSDRLGGKIQSANIDGYHLEFGPNTVLINHPETKAFLEYLEHYDKRIEPNPKAIKRRFVLKNGKPQAIPYSVGSLLKSKLISLNTIFAILKEPFIKSGSVSVEESASAEESLADFSRRRFGQQIYEDLITPFVSGIYAGDPERMSLKYTMPLLNKAEESYGSVVKGMPKLIKEKRADLAEYEMPKQKIFSFKGGLADMINAAAAKIEGRYRLQSEVKKISRNGEKYRICIETNGKEEILEVEKIISTIPSHILATKLDLEESLSEAIRKINYVPALVTHLAFKANQWKFKRESFGLLSRKQEAQPWLGILFNSEFFPQQQQTDDVLLTIISGGYRQPEILSKSDPEILEMLNVSINEIGLAKGKAVFSHLYRWEKAIPQYELGYSAIEKEIIEFQKAHPKFRIGGNYFNGVSVSDCIANGTTLAKEI